MVRIAHAKAKARRLAMQEQRKKKFAEFSRKMKVAYESYLQNVDHASRKH